MTTIQELVGQNLWWRDPRAIEQDPKLLQLDAQPFQRRPAVLDSFRLDQPNVYTLRGPRQVGKSTATKMLIRDLIRSGFPPRRILYASMELERNPKALRDKVICVESKHAARIDGDMKKVIRNSFGKGLIVSRDTLELGDRIRVVPVAVMLSLLT